MTIVVSRRRTAWVRKNLFGGVWSSLVTIGLGLTIGYVAFQLIRFLATSDFTILRRNLALFMVGSFPLPELWRVGTAVLILALAAGVAGG